MSYLRAFDTNTRGAEYRSSNSPDYDQLPALVPTVEIRVVWTEQEEEDARWIERHGWHR